MLSSDYQAAIKNFETGKNEHLKILLRNKIPLWPAIDKFEEQNISAIIAQRKQLTQNISEAIFYNWGEGSELMIEQLAELAGPYLVFEIPEGLEVQKGFFIHSILDKANISYISLEEFHKGDIRQPKDIFSRFNPNNRHFREMAIMTNNKQTQDLLDSYESESQKKVNDFLKKMYDNATLKDLSELQLEVQTNPNVSLTDPSKTAAEQEKAINLLLYNAYVHYNEDYLASHICDLHIMIDPKLIAALKKESNHLKEAYEITDLAKLQHQRIAHPTTFKLIETYELQAMKRDFPLKEEDKKAFISAIEDTDILTIIDLLEQNIYPDLECYDLATLHGNEEICELIKESLSKNQFSKALKDNNVLSMFLLNERGLLVDVETCLENLNSPAAVALLFKSARKQYGEDNHIKRLLEIKPDLFEKIGKYISDDIGRDLIRNCVRSNNLACLDELRATGSKLNYNSISVSYFHRFLSSSQYPHPNIDDLLPMIRKLRQNGWEPDIDMQALIFDRIKKSSLQQHEIEVVLGLLKKEGFGLVTREIDEEIRRIGHVLGLSDDSMPIWFNEGAEKKLTLKFEGGYSGTSLGYVSDDIDEYTQFLKDGKDENESDFAAVKQILDFSKRQFDGFKTKDGAADIFLNQYQNGNIVHLPSAYNTLMGGHAVGLVLYKGYLVYTNRGHRAARGGKTNVFKLKDPALITADLIKNLTSETLTLNEFAFEQTLETLVDLKNPLISFPTKAQKRGNCSYANQKSSIEPLLCLIQAQKEGGADFTDETLKQVAKKSIENREKGGYKKFTKFAGEHEIKRIIKKMQDDCKENPVAINLHYHLFKVIINQLNGKILDDVKNQYEIGHINALLKALPPDKQAKMRHELPFLNDLLNKLSPPVLQSRPKSVVFSSRVEPQPEQLSDKAIYEKLIDKYVDPSTTGSTKENIANDLIKHAEVIISKADLAVTPAKIEWEKMMNALESNKETFAGLLHRISELPGAEKVKSEKRPGPRPSEISR